MAHSRFTARRGWGRWVGSFADVASIARFVEKLASERGGDIATSVTVEQPGLTLEYDSPDEFVQQTQPDDIARIISIRVSAKSGDQADPLTVSVSFDPVAHLEDAAYIRVAGPDRTLVEGIRTQLVERVVPGNRFPWVSGLTVALIIGGALGVVFLGLSATGVVYDSTPQSVKDLGDWAAWIVVGSCLAFGAVLTAPWALLFPRFEWVDDGDDRMRWDRWRRRVIAATGTIVAGVVATLIADALV